MFLARPARAPETTTWDGVLQVPFAQKDTAKALGAAWDNARRVWVVPLALRARRSDFQAWDMQAQAKPVLPAEAQELLELKRSRITRELAQALYGSSVVPQGWPAPPRMSLAASSSH